MCCHSLARFAISPHFPLLVWVICLTTPKYFQFRGAFGRNALGNKGSAFHAGTKHPLSNIALTNRQQALFFMETIQQTK